MTKKTLITGASGLIGSNLVNKLKNQKNLRLLVRGSLSYKLPSNVEVYVGDIRNIEDVKNACTDVSEIIHCAGLISYKKRDNNALYETNVIGTLNILDVALELNINKIVHVSSTLAQNPTGPYSESKRKAELICQDYIGKGLDIVIARPAGGVYGYGDKNQNSIHPFKSVFNSNICIVPPGSKSYVTVNDLVDGLALCLEKGTSGKQYSFVSENLTFSQVYSDISTSLNKKIIQIIIPQETKKIILRMVACTGFNKELVELAYNVEMDRIPVEEKELGWYPSKKIIDVIPSMIKYYGLL